MRVNELTKVMWAHSPPLEEGWTRHQVNGAKPPIMERTGWSLTNHVAECILEPWLVSDHPVCGRFGGFAAFLLSRSHPSSRGGECAHNQQFADSFTRKL